MIAALCSIICFKKLSRTVPYNYLILLVFTLSLSFTVMFATTRYDSKEVLMAAALTTVMVLSLTLYAFCTKEDITVSGGSIPIVSTVFAFVTIYYIFNRDDSTWGMVYCGLGAILFGLYLIYDTYRVIGGGESFGSHYELGSEDYILAVMILYLDIINLFLFILRLLGQNQRR